MGNCQAVEAATVVIHHPAKGKVDSVYWSVNASQVMADNPGYYVATIVKARPKQNSTSSSTTTNRNGDGAVKYVKLLSPDEILHVGHAYRLVSFEDVLEEFGSKKRVRLSRLIEKEKERRIRENYDEEEEDGSSGQSTTEKIKEKSARNNLVVEEKREESAEEMVVGRNVNMELFWSRSISRTVPLKHGQWKPTLQTIAEIGS